MGRGGGGGVACALLVISNRASRGNQSLVFLFLFFCFCLSVFDRSSMGIQFGRWVSKSLLWTDAIWGLCSLNIRLSRRERAARSDGSLLLLTISDLVLAPVSVSLPEISWGRENNGGKGGP